MSTLMIKVGIANGDFIKELGERIGAGIRSGKISPEDGQALFDLITRNMSSFVVATVNGKVIER